ncbi:GNAT family N-acetyltransferase [Curtobacterium sp. VKM Ac-2865]|uniref:GNAT family N-acetyltransferase n=1 Tax=Curtobacterium sp. VKM Ac-2865 TaxID=2783817 RepID=UPI00188D6C6B|nr:GNAT family N-acetyltransferase [Curtobacterium sp. VKM Ac-2865]MBF4583744.1 GNAT family N-acetyltransferase [Curtobacterium sp. VKM Ac-2865]
MDRVIELDVPRTMDDDPAAVAVFREWVAVSARSEVAVHGLAELVWTAEAQLAMLHDPEAPSRLFVVRDDHDVVVAAGSYDSKTAPGTPNCWLSVGVDPDHRRRGVGTLLADHLEGIARAEGRTQWKTYAVSRQVGPATGPGYLQAPTGFGAVPEDEAGVRFLTGRGWRFGQVNRISRLALPTDRAVVQALHDRAAAAAGTDFRVHAWSGPTPPRWQEGIALLETRMSTDAPEGDMEEPEDVWTVERLQEHDALLDASPRTMLTVAVEHAPSGTLAGFTQLAVPDATAEPVFQWDTLVLREHRGHRLGWLLKVVGIETVERDHPGHPSIITFNAEENRPMLDVNEAVGFVGVGSEGVWERRVGAGGGGGAGGAGGAAAAGGAG